MRSGPKNHQKLLIVLVVSFI